MDKKVQVIHESMINGQKKQAVALIDEYGQYDFWQAYTRFLYDTYESIDARYEYFSDATISYHRITNR